MMTESIKNPDKARSDDVLLFLPPPSPEPDDDAATLRAVTGVIILRSVEALIFVFLSKGLLLSSDSPLLLTGGVFDPVLGSGDRGTEESSSEDSPSETSELGAIEESFTPSVWLTA
jgi:hypothetical protein